jgi:concentrative nucleoside transporter, CNT family
VAFLFSNNRGRVPWRTVVVGLAIQVAFAALVLRWSVGRDVLDFVAGQVTALIKYTNDGVDFLFGKLVADKQETIFALQVLPMIIFLGALVGLLYYLRVIQWVVEIVGGAIAALPHEQGGVALRGHRDLPGPVRGAADDPVVPQAAHSFRAVRGDDWRLRLGGRLDARGLRAARGAAALPARRDRHERSRLALHGQDATARGALNGGRIAVIVGCLLIAFIALIAMANGLLSGIGSGSATTGSPSRRCSDGSSPLWRG